MNPIFLLIPGLLIVLITLVVWTRRENERFKERFPPISDEEFVARCSPGTDPDRALRVRRIIADHLAVDYDRVYPSTRFIEDLGAD